MGWSKIFSLLMENDAQSDARKQLARENAIKDAGELGGGVENDPNAVAKVASDTPFTDSTFNANNINRVRPINPALDKQSQFKATDFANKYNVQQQSAEAAGAREMADLPAKTNELIRARNIEQQNTANNALDLRGTEINNQVYPEFSRTPFDTTNPLPGDVIDSALQEYNKYGQKSQSEGYGGAELGQDEVKAKIGQIKALTDYTNERPLEKTPVATPHFDNEGNMSIVSPDGKTITRHIMEKDPKTMQPTGRYKVVKTDLTTGATFEPNPFSKGSTSSNSTLGPINKSRAAPSSGPSVLDRIKGVVPQVANMLNDSLAIPFVDNSTPRDAINKGVNAIKQFRTQNAGVGDELMKMLKGGAGDSVYELDNFLQQLMNARRQTPAQ